MSINPCNFIDPTAVIGKSSKVWHFAVILQDVSIGENCSIGSHTEIGRGSSIDDGSRISSQVFLPPHSQIGKCVFIGPGCVFTDDKRPRVNNPNYTPHPPVIEDHAAIGAGCVILPGIHIGHHALIGAGSVVTRDVPPNSLVYGDHARIRTTETQSSLFPDKSPFDPSQYDLPYGKVSLAT